MNIILIKMALPCIFDQVDKSEETFINFLMDYNFKIKIGVFNPLAQDKPYLYNE